jgi:hypothetical protein
VGIVAQPIGGGATGGVVAGGKAGCEGGGGGGGKGKGVGSGRGGELFGVCGAWLGVGGESNC